MSWLYRPRDSKIYPWQVGFINPQNGEWTEVSIHDTEKDAGDKVHYLNGGEATP